MHTAHVVSNRAGELRSPLMRARSGPSTKTNSEGVRLGTTVVYIEPCEECYYSSGACNDVQFPISTVSVLVHNQGNQLTGRDVPLEFD
jgi:hypothetical protein